VPKSGSAHPAGERTHRVASRGHVAHGEGRPILQTDKDIWSGLFFIALGALGLWLGWDYAFGTTARMGPGFVPKLLCWLLVATGGIVTAVGIIRRGPGMDRWQFRPLVFVLASVLVFGALIEQGGLVPATMGMVLVGAAGSLDTRWIETTVLGAVLAGMSVLIFVRGLGLPMKIMAGF
jgi:putative tricarboxylic transport membrane protein